MKKRRLSQSWLFAPFVLLIRVFVALIHFLWKRLAWCLTAASALTVFFWVRQALYADPYFGIDTVRIFPRGILSESEYTRIEKASIGKNLLTFNLDSLSSLIELNPKVKRATVIRQLPNELDIYMVPRKPELQLQVAPRGNFYLLGTDNTVMAINEDPDPKHILLMDYHYPQKKLSLFEKYQPKARLLIERVLETWPTSEATKREVMQRMSLDHLGNLSVHLLNGPELIFGESGVDHFRKLEAVRHLLEGAERQNLVYIDLRYADVVIKKRSS